MSICGETWDDSDGCQDSVDGLHHCIRSREHTVHVCLCGAEDVDT